MKNPTAIMKVFNKRRLFLDKHPEFYPFLQKLFGQEIQAGTVLEVSAEIPGNVDKEKIRMEIGTSELEFFQAVKEMIG